MSNLSVIPRDTAPSGSTAHELSHTLLSSIAWATATAYAAVIMRLMSRRYLKVGLMTDDWLSVLALAPFTGWQITVGLQVIRGLGKHTPDVEDISEYAKIIIPAQTCYILTLALTKLSVLYFFQRIIPRQTLFVISRIIGAVVVAYSIAMIVVVIVQCRWGSTQWVESGATGICVSRGWAFNSLAILNSITTLAILILPINSIMRLKMSLCRKLHVAAIFVAGGGICAVSIIRISLPLRADPGDTAFAGGEGAFWSQLELAAAVFCACSPTYRPLCSMAQDSFKKAKSLASQSISSKWSRHDSSLSERSLQNSRQVDVEKGKDWPSITQIESIDDEWEEQAVSDENRRLNRSEADMRGSF